MRRGREGGGRWCGKKDSAGKGGRYSTTASFSASQAADDDDASHLFVCLRSARCDINRRAAAAASREETRTRWCNARALNTKHKRKSAAIFFLWHTRNLSGPVAAIGLVTPSARRLRFLCVCYRNIFYFVFVLLTTAPRSLKTLLRGVVIIRSGTNRASPLRVSAERGHKNKNGHRWFLAYKRPSAFD